MRNILIVFLYLNIYSLGIIKAQKTCLEGETNVTSQAQLDSLMSKNEGCTCIAGTLSITGTDVNNLWALSNINKINGGLFIRSTQIPELYGLHNIDTIAGNFGLSENYKLKNLFGMNSLVHCGELFISYERELRSLNGLSRLKSITNKLTILNNSVFEEIGINMDDLKIGGLVIEKCNLLTAIEGFHTVDTLKLPFQIIENQSLKYINVLRNCMVIKKDLFISGSYYLEKIEDLNQVESIDVIFLTGQANMKALPKFPKLKYIRKLDVHGANSIKNFEGLESVKKIGRIQISSNRDLVSFKGFDNLESVETDLRLLNIQNQATSINSFNKLKNVGGELCIESLFGIKNLDGFDNLESAKSIWLNSVGIKTISAFGKLTHVRDSLHVWSRPLKSLEAFKSIKSALVNLYVFSDSLQSLSGLDNIDHRALKNVIIEGNNQLSECSVRSICNYLMAPNGKVKIGNNATGCNSAEEILAKCPVSGLDKLYPGRISVYPNPANDFIHLHFDNPVSGRIVVYDMHGHKVQYTGSIVDEQQFSIDVSDWPSGLYTLQLYPSDRYFGPAVAKVVVW